VVQEEAVMIETVRRAGRQLVLVVIVVAAAALAAPAVAAVSDVDIAGNAFAPQSITVHVGDRVRWTNSDARSHTATADNGSFNTGTVHNGETSAPVTFSTVGTVTYHCSIHPDMHGTVVVAAALPPTDSAAPGQAGHDGPPSSVPALIAVLALGLCVGLRRFRRST
jgi:plastocyanin